MNEGVPDENILFRIKGAESLPSTAAAIGREIAAALGAGVLMTEGAGAVAVAALAASSPPATMPQYKAFALSSVAVRQVSFDRVEVFHSAHMMAAGSYEQAEARELEYMRGKYSPGDGWTCTVGGLEMTGGFMAELLRLKLRGQLDTSADPAQKSVLLTVHLGDREAVKVESKSSDLLEASDDLAM